MAQGEPRPRPIPKLKSKSKQPEPTEKWASPEGPKAPLAKTHGEPLGAPKRRDEWASGAREPSQCQCQFSQSLDAVWIWWSRSSGAVQLLLRAQRRLSLAPTISIFMQTITPSDLHQHRMQISAAYGQMESHWS